MTKSLVFMGEGFNTDPGGGPPFGGDNRWDLYQAHFSMDAGPLNLVRPEVPVELAAVVAKMKSMPTDDRLFGKGTIRQDGRKIHDMFLFEVKKPEESKGAWDYYKQLATIPAEEAWRPLDQDDCPLVKK